MKARSVKPMGEEPADRGAAVRTAPDSFDSLFLAEYGKVVAVANRVLADRQEAEDVAQEVFLDFHRKHPADAGYAPAWLQRAAVHTALNRIRSRKRRERREVNDANLRTDTPPDPQDVLVVNEERRRVRQALSRLATKPASLLALRYSGLSYVEIGATLGVGTNQIGTLLRRAEQSLLKELNRVTPA
ncbi:sigma-70 family RNA polymerase sigma factor [Candidatus Dormiibacter inghamiae]